MNFIDLQSGAELYWKCLCKQKIIYRNSFLQIVNHKNHTLVEFP
jgi:hypothetical protein